MSTWRIYVAASTRLGSRPMTAPELIRQGEFPDRGGYEIDILDIDLSCIHARANPGDATTACLGLPAAHDLHAIREDLGLIACGSERLEKGMRRTVRG